jgi:hypothetical protein
VNGAQIIPRPFAEQIHATERNHIIHYDYLYINKKNPDFSYVLVLKEDLSHFTRLVPSKDCDHFTVVDALMEWYADFGSPSIHVSDQGTHFKNSVIAELHRLSGSRHHYTVAYSPWSNGTVEIVNESILRCLRSLLSEFKMKPSEWPKLLCLVQGVLNHSPSRTLGGLSPITVFTGLPPRDPFQCIYDDASKTWRTCRLSNSEIIELHSELKESLLNMHKKVIEQKSIMRSRKRNASSNRNKRSQRVNFDLGDFVLVATVNRKDKLEAKWKGPFRITKVLNELVYEVQNLLTNKKKEVHAIRLSQFQDSKIDSNVKEYIQFHNDNYEIEEIMDKRINQGVEEVLVKWKGFEPEESTWEPLEIIKEDVPQLVESFLRGSSEGQ